MEHRTLPTAGEGLDGWGISLRSLRGEVARPSEVTEIAAMGALAADQHKEWKGGGN